RAATRWATTGRACAARLAAKGLAGRTTLRAVTKGLACRATTLGAVTIRLARRTTTLRAITEGFSGRTTTLRTVAEGLSSWTVTLRTATHGAGIAAGWTLAERLVGTRTTIWPVAERTLRTITEIAL